MTLSTPEFVGREPILDAVVQRARGGGSTVLSGPVGVGRSRFVAEAAAQLERAGRRVLRLTATASAASVPFGVLLGLLDRPTILRIGAEDALGRAAIVRAALLALEPQAVLVDEASLLDPASAAFLLELARGRTAVVLTVTTGRRVPDAVRALVDDGLASAVRLDPLDLAGCSALAAAVLGGPVDAALAAALVDVAEGSPTAVQEVLRVAVASGAVATADAMWRLQGDLPAPAAARRRAGAAFLALPGPAQDWLCAVAIADGIADDVAERLCADDVADELQRAGWTSHDTCTRTTRLRRVAQSEAVLEHAGARRRRSTVRRLLQATARLDRPLGDRERITRGAWRLELGDEVLAADALELGALASLTDPELSERFLRHAVAVGGGAVAEVLLAEQLQRTNRPAEAERLLGAATAAPGQPAAEVAKVLALVAGFGSRRSTQALAVLEAQLEAHGDQVDLQAVRAGLLRTEMRYAESLAASEPLRRGPVGFASVFAGINEVLVRTETGDPWAAMQVLDALRRPAQQVVDRIPEGPAVLDWLSAWTPAVACLDLRSAEPIALHGYDRMLASGTPAVRTPFAHLLGVIRCLDGAPDAAAHLLREAVGLPGVWRDSWLPVVLADLAVALVRTGDLAGARAALDRAEGGAATAVQRGRLRLAEAELLAAGDDAAGAVATAQDVAQRAAGLGAAVEEWDARFLAMRFGGPSVGEPLLALAPLPGVARAVQLDHARALLSGDPAELDGVARRYWAIGLRVYAVETAGTSLRIRADRGLPTTAPAERLAQWAAEVPALRLQPTGVVTANALTSREREVVTLAARGLPDRGVAEELGISVRTAQTHLSRAFTKLGVHRRAELVGLIDDQR